MGIEISRAKEAYVGSLISPARTHKCHGITLLLPQEHKRREEHKVGDKIDTECTNRSSMTALRRSRGVRRGWMPGSMST